GTVVATPVQEGQAVAAGARILELSNLDLESVAARTGSDYELAVAAAVLAEQQYRHYGAALRERDRLAEQNRLLQAQLAHLDLQSPISGVVVTPRPSDLLGARLAAGTPVLEVADLSRLRARVFTPEVTLRRIHVGCGATLLLDDGGSISGLQVASLARASSQIDPGLMEAEAYKGMQGAQFYALTISVPNTTGKLREGMTGTARVVLQRRSLAAFAGQAVFDFVARKIW
ncbi:MAG TPA: HlyD family efflux transporter periplasmic adaptor subunit, partial [Terriglobales bacterium]|nr:HlyD family efflux transporter periplasmic adaptor subunit [Terriglobales bacterium]